MRETSSLHEETRGHERGTSGYRRLDWALWFGGFATFMLVHCPQALLPTLAAHFRVSSAQSSLALSATIGGLAVAMVPLSWIAESWDRIRVLTWAFTAAAVLGLLASVAPTFWVLVTVRAAQGVVLSAVPALLMSHVTREVAPRWLGGAMGKLIAGNTLGGLCGRLIAGSVSEFGGWRLALATIGVVSLACTVAFRLLVPPPTAADPPPERPLELGRTLRVHLTDPGLRYLCGLAFLLLGSFETVYNYLGFRLIAPPFDVAPALAGLIFLAYLAGSWASTAAGRLGDRVGRRRIVGGSLLVAVVGIWTTAFAWLPAVLFGLVLVTVGFFGAHSAASGWVGRRSSKLPGGSPAVASSLYQVAYYLGGGLGGFFGGITYDHAGWLGPVSFVTGLLAIAVALYLLLQRLPPIGKQP